MLYTTNGLNACTSMPYMVCALLRISHHTPLTKNSTDTQRQSNTPQHRVYKLVRSNPCVDQDTTVCAQQSTVCYQAAQACMYKIRVSL